MPGPMSAIPVVAPDEVEELSRLKRSARRVHKSVPAHSPVRQASADLSHYLYRLHRRGVPLKVLARLVGLSHQAVRVRVRTAAEADARSPAPGVSAVNGAPRLRAPTDAVVLIADAGIHRRLHIYDPPGSVGAAYLALAEEIPLLRQRDHIVAWMETQADTTLGSSTASPLRIPPSVYLPRDV